MEIPENPRPIIGYSDKITAQPGDQVNFMVSSDLPKYHADVVRLIHGGPVSPGPGPKEVLIRSLGDFTGKAQPIPRGSYVQVEAVGPFDLKSFTLQAWISPTLPKKGVQGILTHWNEGSGYGLFIDDGGHLSLMMADSSGKMQKLVTGKSMQAPNWYFVACTFDAASGEATLYQEDTSSWLNGDSEIVRKKLEIPGQMDSGPFLIAAHGGRVGSREGVVGHFNGKIDRPRVFSRPLSSGEVSALKGGASPRAYLADLVAEWDFSADISSSFVRDVSPHSLHGRAVNIPKRAVTGYNWSGDEGNYNCAPNHYGAIHFHDDDLEDCKWDVAFQVSLPEDLKSGVYAAKLTAGKDGDYIPFFVRPRKGTATAKIAFLVPTLSYFAYANFHNLDAVMFENFKFPVHPDDRYAVKEKLHSLYDHHTDGSGVCYFSRLQPNLTIRPDHIAAGMWGGKGSIRDFSEDLCLVDWLEQKGFEYDIITDEDLHADGVDLLSPYKAVITGAHPEYWSGSMLDGLDAYLQGGGRFMYLGGNGFYWITSVDPARPHIIEVRRWGGTQSWRSAPGEYYHSGTGELGGLWRNRGRAPQKLVGIGFSAQGFDTNSPYKRQPDSFNPRAAFIFEGIGKDELIGNHANLCQGFGAAGDELDRADVSLGTPLNALIVATAKDTFSDYYQAVVEEVDLADSKQGGTKSPMVKADIVFYEGPNDGAVFSVGSIAWIGGLADNNYNNTTSKVTENVLRKFGS